MTQWLIHRFVKNHPQVKDPQVRGAYGRLAGWVGIGCNALLAGSKLMMGLLSGSVSILADAANNLSDASASVVSLLGFKMASKPPDEEHPYGHARYEYLAGLTVAVLILVIGFELGRGSVQKLLAPTPVQFSWLSVAVLGASVLVKLWMMAFNRRLGALIDSKPLIATAADSRNDVITTLAVMGAALISHFAGVELDGWMGLGVAAFILYSGFGLIKDTLDPLLGQAPDPELVQQIREAILEYPGVLGTHDLLLHDYGPGRRFGSVHVEMAAEEDILDSHDIIDDMERGFMEHFNIHMIVHLDPIITSDPLVQDLRLWLSQKVTDIHPEMSIHDLRVVKGRGHRSAIFNCIRPHGFEMPDAQLKMALCDLVRRHDPKFRCVITIDESFAAVPKEPDSQPIGRTETPRR